MDENFEKLTTAVRAFEAKRVWAVNTSEVTAPAFSLDLGERVRVPHADNPAFKVKEEGEYIFFVLCSWRVMDGRRILASSLDEPAADGPMIVTLKNLAGTTVTDTSVKREGLDVSLGFDDGKRLDVFSDHTTRSIQRYCYFLKTPENFMTLENGGEIHVEENLETRKDQETK